MNDRTLHALSLYDRIQNIIKELGDNGFEYEGSSHSLIDNEMYGGKSWFDLTTEERESSIIKSLWKSA